MSATRTAPTANKTGAQTNWGLVVIGVAHCPLPANTLTLLDVAITQLRNAERHHDAARQRNAVAIPLSAVGE